MARPASRRPDAPRQQRDGRCDQADGRPCVAPDRSRTILPWCWVTRRRSVSAIAPPTRSMSVSRPTGGCSIGSGRPLWLHGHVHPRASRGGASTTTVRRCQRDQAPCSSRSNRRPALRSPAAAYRPCVGMSGAPLASGQAVRRLTLDQEIGPHRSFLSSHARGMAAGADRAYGAIRTPVRVRPPSRAAPRFRARSRPSPGGDQLRMPPPRCDRFGRAVRHAYARQQVRSLQGASLPRARRRCCSVLADRWPSGNRTRSVQSSLGLGAIRPSAS